MVKIIQSRQNRAPGRGVLFAAMAVLWSVFAGCTHTPVMTNVQPKPDPLYGVPPAPQFPNQAPIPGVQPTAAVQSGIPAIPALHSPTNNATLAGMTGQVPINGSFAINDATRNQAPGQLLTAPKQTPPVFLPPNPNPKVEPVPDANAPRSLTPTASWQSSAITPPTTPRAPPAPPVAPPSEESLTKALQDRGVINQKRDQTPDGVRLTCYVAVGDTGLRVYEATAPTYMAAAQAILQQLDAK